MMLFTGSEQQTRSEKDYDGEEEVKSKTDSDEESSRCESLTRECYDFWAQKLDDPETADRPAANFFIYMRVIPPTQVDTEARLETLAPRASGRASLQTARTRARGLMDSCRDQANSNKRIKLDDRLRKALAGSNSY